VLVLLLFEELVENVAGEGSVLVGSERVALVGGGFGLAVFGVSVSVAVVEVSVVVAFFDFGDVGAVFDFVEETVVVVALGSWGDTLLGSLSREYASLISLNLSAYCGRTSGWYCLASL
jgi:hypothetical protein